MAELIYDETGRLLFTEEMRREYTILVPMMLPVHMTFLVKILREQGFRVELLTSTSPAITDLGLQSVHNDTCYPALLVIGQMMEALESGKYDMDKVALIITQTGGGCRASNYIHLLRKALQKRGWSHIPVISFNLAGMEKNPGFRFSPKVYLEMLGIVVYADLIMNLANQTRPYELRAGDADAMIERWTQRLLEQKLSVRRLSRTLAAITADFAAIPVRREPKVTVGVVGEIYIKYAALGNNNLEQLLADEGCEVVVPGLLDFVIFMGDHHLVDTRRYRIKWKKGLVSALIKVIFSFFQRRLIRAIRQVPSYRVPADFGIIKRLAGDYVSDGNKMGEGWLLTGEIVELIHAGIGNIICTQPFGCLPNHIVGKGMIRAIRGDHPDANIVCVDYDPGATRTNQENRIKLMLSVARERLTEKSA
ncbi:MAG: 2-hydroxyacyl-CoA dehydratase [Oscillospiraceae bacterium]|jgi:predicted nucleotide-binding protein (sugar kinase/HSP70/actin superfamily)|nr:2-hydroxyacyl-CoA dehydratase [Oscillospiraceae bacterium]